MPIKTVMTNDPNDFSNQYNTALSDEDEAAFQNWASTNNRVSDSYDYDIRGAWKAMQDGSVTQGANGHFPDTYKKPNHPTFSNQSKYTDKDNIGGVWSTDENGKDVYTPSTTNLRYRSMEDLQKYFQRVEPTATLRSLSKILNDK